MSTTISADATASKMIETAKEMSASMQKLSLASLEVKKYTMNASAQKSSIQGLPSQ
ncbi:MAG: hypothetical protein ACRBBN_05015 [Methyloligellaceae bacterium]